LAHRRAGPTQRIEVHALLPPPSRARSPSAPSTSRWRSTRA
jgi:hypothetical protein